MGNITSALDVKKACRAKNEAFNISDCLPQFLFNSTNNVVGVSSFGGVEPGKLQTDPDIAGIGVLLAFIIPSAIALGIGAILSIRPINDRLPERLQSKIVNSVAPARPERLKVEHESRHSIFPGRDRRPGTIHENYKQSNYPVNQGNYPAHSYPVNARYHLQSQYPAHQEYHSQPQNLHDDENPSVQSNPVDVEDVTSGSDDKTPFSEIFYDMLQAALQAITDSQILLSLALNFSFFVLGKCEMSLYHFRLGLNIIEIACANSFLSLLLVRDYWKAPASAILRLFALTLSIYLLYNLLDIQQERGYSAERLPPPERNNSLVLLKALCFLNKDLGDAIFANRTDATFTNSTDQFFATTIANQTINHVTLTKEEYEAVGPLDYMKSHPEWIFVNALIANLVLTIVYAGFRFLRKFTRNSISHIIFFTYCLGTWIFCLVVLCRNASYIFDLRQWVNGSGWFGTDSENYVGLGQWAALMAMGGVLFSFLDKWKPYGNK